MNHTPHSAALPVLWCLGSAALFGASTPASKALLDGALGPLSLAGLLYLGAALATLPSALKGGRSERQRDPANLRRLGGAICLLYTSPSPRDKRQSRMPSSA